MSKTGTWEWADSVINIQRGCEHDCRYCYARYNAVHRFGLCKPGQWKEPVIDPDRITRHFGRRNGIVMFPSSHDITPLNLEACIHVLHKLLAVGNRVLIVSKPHMKCIMVLCDELRPFMDRVLFRFTIGSTDNQVLRFWEPGAPNFTERISCLQFAFRSGYQTSVSAEPYLDPQIAYLIEAVSDFVSETIWIGRMRKIKQRVRLDEITEDQKRKFVEPLLLAAGDAFVKMIYELLKRQPKIRWKDSIRKVVGYGEQ